MERKDNMDLSNPSQENIEYILNWVREKLRVVNASMINPDHFGTDSYEDLLDIYHMMERKESFTVSEQEAIISELGRLRKS